ncbi:MAG: hypothetical protein AAF585_16120 [Verrucomicrobiota bacterium]
MNTLLACPFCNSDGSIAREFILIVFGGAIASFVCLLLWTFSSGHLRGVEKPGRRLIEIDQETEVRNTLTNTKDN